MRLLIIALTSLSTGEVGVGLDVARQLRRVGVTSHFVVEPPGEWLVRAEGFGVDVVRPELGAAVSDRVAAVVAEQRPDMLVLSDYFTFCAELELQFHVDPWFVEALGVPIVPIDVYEWCRTDFQVELLPGRPFAVSPHLRELPVALRPVPSAHPTPAAGERALTYRSCTTDDRVDAETKRQVLHSLGLRPGRDRMLLIPISRWHHPMPQILGHPAQRVTERLPDLIARYLRALPTGLHTVLVGPPMPALEAALDSPQIHLLPPCDPDRFSRLIGAADAMFSFHLPSQTLVRSLFADVPAVAMRNSFTVTDPDSRERLERAVGGTTPAVAHWLDELDAPILSFESWPWRLNSTLTPLFTDNPMLPAILRGEVLDERGFVETLTSAVFDDTTRARLAGARRRYRQAIADVPPVEVALAEAARIVGVGARPA